MELQNLRNTHNWNLPETCPVCGGILELNENHTLLSCTNELCPSKSSGNIMKWCEKMKIKEMGLTTIELIQSNGYFMTIPSMYDEYMNKDISDVLHGILGKNYDNIRTEIDSHTHCTLSVFISGFNINGIGEKQVQKIIDSFGYSELKDFYGDDPNRFICDGIGEILSHKLSDGIDKFKSLMERTLQFITIDKPNVTVGSLTGKSFCFTGSMEYKRSVLQGYVEREGGINFDSVKKGLSYLVMADPNSTSSKAVKARSLGITIISPDEFLKMVGEDA